MDLSTFEDLKDRVSLSGMGKPALAGLLAVILAVAALAAGRLAGPAAADSSFEVSKAAEATGAQAESDAGQEPAAAQTLFVHVSGAVARPGLYELPASARVGDAVEAAGGFGEGADAASVNLARVLADGEQVVVAEKGAAPAASGQAGSLAAAGAPAAAGGAAGAGSGASAAASSAGSGLVNINTASASELQSLPGIGEVTASRIVDYRAANGPFANIEALKAVSGIGDKKYEAIAGMICA